MRLDDSQVILTAVWNFLEDLLLSGLLENACSDVLIILYDIHWYEIMMQESMTFILIV